MVLLGVHVHVIIVHLCLVWECSLRFMDTIVIQNACLIQHKFLMLFQRYGHVVVILVS